MLQVGDQIERYEVEAFLGEGGLARVYCVRHAALGSRFALKVLSFRGKRLTNRLLREGQIQAQLKHPNVVAVVDVIEHDGRAGLLMEFVEGESLEQALNRRGAMTIDEALDLFSQVLAGVSAAHDAGVLHRDLKPGNILLQPVGDTVVAKVTDFGIARLLSTEAQGGDTLQSDVIGTPGYMAPEQASDPTAVDVRADLFSLGALLYGMVTGAPPFKPGGLAQMLSDVELGRFRPVRELLPDCPGDVARAIERCLAPDPDARFDGCRALAVALYGAESDELASLHRAVTPSLGALAGSIHSVPPGQSVNGLTAVPPDAASIDDQPLVAAPLGATSPPGRGRAVWMGLAAVGVLALGIAGAVMWGDAATTAPPPEASLVADPPPLQPIERGDPPVNAPPLAPPNERAPAIAAPPEPGPAPDSAASRANGPAAIDPPAPSADPGSVTASDPAPAAPSPEEPAAVTPSEAPDAAEATPDPAPSGDPSLADEADEADAAEAQPSLAPAPDQDGVADAATAAPAAPAPPSAPPPEAAPPPDLKGVWQGRLGGRPSTLRVTEQRGPTVKAELEVLLGTAYRTFVLAGSFDGDRLRMKGDDPEGWALDVRLDGGALDGTLTPPGRKKGTPWRGSRQ